jgi:hypothetical protein
METARAGPIASTSWRDYSTTGDSRRYRDERQIEREALQETSRQAGTRFPTTPATAAHFLRNHIQFRADFGEQVNKTQEKVKTSHPSHFRRVGHPELQTDFKSSAGNYFGAIGACAVR